MATKSTPKAKPNAKAGEPMDFKAMVDAMAKQGLWTTPGGATPNAMLTPSSPRSNGANSPRLASRKDHTNTPEQKMADAVRAVALRLEKTLERGRRWPRIDVNDLLETLLAIADEIDPRLGDPSVALRGG